MPLTQQDFEDLCYAKSLLENPGFGAKIMHILGAPLENSIQHLPKEWFAEIEKISQKAIGAALSCAMATMNENSIKKSKDTFHKAAAATCGCLGGAFGLAALSLELPISTTIMLRSIADIARSEGSELKNIQTRLSCLEVFALGGKSPDDDGSETGYYALRFALGKAVSDATAYITQMGLRTGIIGKGSPILLKFISKIASRFGVIVTQKAAATAVPIVGAASGALINTIFIDHFQNMARGHFIIRRLERTYDPNTVKAEYYRL
jgi:hypothetical protein